MTYSRIMTSAQLNALSENKATAVVRSIFGENFWARRHRGNFRVCFTEADGRSLAYDIAGEGKSWTDAVARAARVCGLVNA